ncbi:MAG: hypothetical protein ACRDSK_26330 [Actinophytocola sp.]|uniref:hypothetical protein n=1 Tax=Actinophytocola sp. TaxID=1872138 RepID=UPI003D6A2BC3
MQSRVPFSDDVVVLIDGQEAWRRSGVTTNYSVGLAAIAEVPAALGTTVEVCPGAGRIGRPRYRFDLVVPIGGG